MKVDEATQNTKPDWKIMGHSNEDGLMLLHITNYNGRHIGQDNKLVTVSLDKEYLERLLAEYN